MYRFFSFLLFLICMTFVSVVRAEETELSVSAELFGQLPLIKSIKLSPNGKRAVMLRNVGGRYRVVIVSLDRTEGVKPKIIPYDEGEFNWVRWANNDRLLLSIRFPAKRYGTETTETRLIGIDWDAANAQNLGERSAGRDNHFSQFQDNVIDILPDDPDHILLGLDRSRVNYPDVYKVNVYTGKRKRVVKTRSSVRYWASDRDGVVRYGLGMNRNYDRVIYRKTADSKWQTIAKYDFLDSDLPFVFEDFGPEPHIIYVSALKNGRQAFYTYDLDKGEFLEEVAANDKVDITSININRKTGKLDSYNYNGEKPQSVIVDPFWKSVYAFLHKQFTDDYVSVISWSRDKKVMIVKVTSPTNPGDYYVLDRNQKTFQWFAEDYHMIDRDKLADMDIVSYKARDGLTIPAYISYPKGKKIDKLPTIIMPHGGPFGVRDHWQFDYWVQFLTTRGYAVLQMNYRGSSGYGQGFESLGLGEWGNKMMEDILDGAKWLVDEGVSDPDQICMMGGSYGGYAALQAVVMEPEMFKCAIAFAPVTDVGRMMNHERQFTNYKRYKAYMKNDELSYSDISPYDHMDKINVPVLVAHGTEDRSVRFLQGKSFAKKMKRKGKDITFLEFEDGDHYLSRQEHRMAFIQAAEKFLKQHLPANP